ncbi:hypothetical protein [Candidatus Pollutiaquabacter sp.]|uniref:hypothetical protein n=1 Tax=Candidatus Pollutiaquabacter sp. TaxID=3416354 RepID=UPI003CAB5129|nr:hypothetical protein [Bacteroidota bacterium]
MMKTPASRLAFLLLILLHLTLGFSAIGGGLLLMLEPDGGLLHMQQGWLHGSVFPNFFLPGLMLTTVIGIIPLRVAFGLNSGLKRCSPGYINVYRSRHWAWTWSLYYGIILCAWIAIQQLLTQYFILQLVILLSGILIIVLTLTPSLMHRYHMNPREQLEAETRE